MTAPAASKTTVAVDGATGYLGNHVVSELLRRGVEVRCIVHAGARERDVQLLASAGAQVFTADLLQPSEQLLTALSGCAAVVHLIGSIAPRKGERLSDLHAGQTTALVNACMRTGVRKIVHVTALGTAVDAPSTYHQTKWQAEEIIRKSGIPFVILRPSLIVGRQVGNRDSKLIARYRELIRSRPTVPLIGGGSNKLQPIFVGDLADAIAESATQERFDGNCYELGGPDVFSMKEIVEKLMVLEGKQRRIKALPPVVAGAIASVLELVQDVPLLSRDQITLATRDNVCLHNALQSTFGISSTRLDDALETYRVDAASVQAEAAGV